MTVSSVVALRRATLVLLLAALIWGSMIPVLGELAHHYDKWLLSWLRYMLGTPVLWLAVLTFPHPGKAAGRLRLGQLLQLGGAMTVFSVLYTFGVVHAHPATAAIVLMCSPIIATLLTRVILGTATPQGFVLTLAMVVGGGVMVVLGAPGRPTGWGGLEGGEFLLLLASICWSWYSIRAQQWLADRGQVALSALSASIASVLLGLVCLAVWATIGFEWPSRPPSVLDFGLIAWLGVFGVAAAVLLWNTGVSLVGLPVASLFSNSAPVFAIGIAALMGTPPSWLQLAGGAIVLGGIGQLQLRQLWRRR